MRLYALFFGLMLLSGLASAKTSICQIEGELIDPKVVTWDTDSLKAKIKYWNGREYEGRVTLIRKHDKGEKVNLSFRPDGMGADEWEYIVFPISKGYRVLGAAFSVKDGMKHLEYVLSGNDALCSTI